MPQVLPEFRFARQEQQQQQPESRMASIAANESVWRCRYLINLILVNLVFYSIILWYSTEEVRELRRREESARARFEATPPSTAPPGYIFG